MSIKSELKNALNGSKVEKYYLYGPGKVQPCSESDVTITQYNYITDESWLERAVTRLEGREFKPGEMYSYYEVSRTDELPINEGNTISFYDTTKTVNVRVVSSDIKDSQRVILKDRTTGETFSMNINKIIKRVSDSLNEEDVDLDSVQANKSLMFASK